MPKTKLSERAKWIKRLKSYKNPDKRCHYPWQLGNLGYCWGFASMVDDKLTKNYRGFCRDCKYWDETLKELQAHNHIMEKNKNE